MYSLFSNKITIIVITIQINKENKKKIAIVAYQ